MVHSLSLVLLTYLSVAYAASLFSPARPPAIPLAVKSPYLSTWLNAGSDYGNGGYLAGQWPVHWTQQTTGWAGMIRVDGKVYQWMGIPSAAVGKNATIPNVSQESFQYTSTKSIFTLNVANKVRMVVTFLSPITAEDFKRQSLPLSYLQVSVVSIDGSEHNTQLYTDITAEWTSGDGNAVAQWEFGSSNGISYHKVWRQTQIEFDENGKPDGNGMANWGNVYYATDSADGISFQSGADYTVRTQFASTGELTGDQDTNYRAINTSYPTFGFANDFGQVTADLSTQLFTIGLLQQNAVQFNGSQGYQPQPSLWTSYWSNEVDAVSFFHKDWSHQLTEATAVDTRVQSESESIAGQNYATITSLSVRQAFGATQLVGTQDKMYLFMKEISSNGNTQTVDVAFPFHPILNFFNPTLLKLYLDPLYENQESGAYPNSYAMHDLGAHYPNATGHPDGKDEEMPVEECGNMLIMTLSYAQQNADVDYLKQHYGKLIQWTGYLVNDSLIPMSQLSTDDFAGSLQNQTNLALKGIIGIRAMGEIARLVGNTADEAHYNNISFDYITQWMNYGIAWDEQPPHTTLNYGANQTHGLLYNLWTDLELGLQLVPQTVYNIQSAFYPTVKAQYGVPLDTRHTYTKSDWEMFTAAYCSPLTRDMFINDLATWINVTPTGKAFTDLYDTVSGDYPGFEFIARPVMGGVFALIMANPEAGPCSRCKLRPPVLTVRPVAPVNVTVPTQTALPSPASLALVPATAAATGSRRRSMRPFTA